jgi:Ca2+-binding EF-hand superfamily protein
MPGKSNEQEGEDLQSHLGEEGWFVRIQCLKGGSLASYNGQKAQAQKVDGKEDLFVVRIKGSSVQLVLHKKYLQVQPNFKTQELPQSSFGLLKSTVNEAKQGNGRQTSSVTSVRNVSARLRAALRQSLGDKATGTRARKEAAMSKGLQDMFRFFDVDSNGLIDKGEFVAGCKRIHVEVSQQEVRLLWPVITKSEMISPEEFFDFASNQMGTPTQEKIKTFRRASAYTLYKQRPAQILAAGYETTKEERVRRIAEKTKHAQVLATLVVAVRKHIHKYLEAQKLSIDEIFRQFDEDGGGTIHRNEFLSQLNSTCGFTINADQLGIIWPVIAGGYTKELNLKYWNHFLSWDHKWTFKNVTDKVMSHARSDLGHDISQISLVLQDNAQDSESGEKTQANEKSPLEKRKSAGAKKSPAKTIKPPRRLPTLSSPA